VLFVLELEMVSPEFATCKLIFEPSVVCAEVKGMLSCSCA
jgi:hypothetical protein